MAVIVTLQQERDILDDKYRVRSTVISAAPDGLYAIFLFEQGGAAYEETYLRVATLDDLEVYVENPLIYLKAQYSGQFLGIPPGTTLTITNAPAEWFDTSFSSATFTISSIMDSGNGLIVQTSKPFPTAKSGLSWSVPGHSGSNAYTRREDIGEGGGSKWFRRHMITLHGHVAEASSHAIAVKTMIDKLVQDSKIHGTHFQGIDTTVHTA